MARPYEPTAHEAFSHDSIDNLGYDWSRVAEPNPKPRPPKKVYFPRTTSDVQAALTETSRLHQEPVIRGKGHSSNDLVFGEVMVCLENLNKDGPHGDGVLCLDAATPRVTVQAGIVLARLDAVLACYRLGLPVIGDHEHITAGGFAAVGGVSPASHVQGLFVDNVLALEYVNWKGQLISLHPRDPDFRRVLASTGRLGVIVTLTLRLVRGNKNETFVRNDRKIVWGSAQFRDMSLERMKNANAQVLFERGLWLDLPVGGRFLRVGQFSQYREQPGSPWARLWNSVAHGWLHFLGYWAGRLPNWLDRLVKLLGTLGVVFSPRHATIKNVEIFTDKVLDDTVGDPSRMLIVFAPLGAYAALFDELYALCLRLRAESALTYVAVYVKGITSSYLSPDAHDPFCELLLFVGMGPKMDATILAQAVSEIDDLCIRHKGFRYMHSRTVPPSDKRREKIDPNLARYP